MRLGIDVGGTKINMVITDDAGHARDSFVFPVPQGISASDVMALTAGHARTLLEKNRVQTHELIRVGMGVPGTTDGHVVLSAPNLGWKDERCADAFEAQFGVRPLLIQDTRAAAWGEYTIGGGQGSKTLVCVTLGTGIGCGIVLNGRIYHGALGTAGEIGHIQVKPEGRLCGCGRYGCMEAYASGTGLRRTCQEQTELKDKLRDTHDLFRAAGEGNAAARSIIEQGVCYAAQAISAVVNVLSPDVLIFSGGLCLQEALYVKPLMEKIRQLSYALAVGEQLMMAVSPLGADAPALGAAML